MKTRLKRAAGILFVLIAFISCDVTDNNTSNCPVVMGVGTTAVTGPTEAAVNEEITLSVSYRIAGACGGFYRFYVDPITVLNEKTITVNITYDACSCDEVYTTKTEPYKFKATAAGTYVLKFRITDTTFITHTIVVE